MHLPSLSSAAITLLIAANAATTLAKVDVLSWDDAYKKAKTLVNKMSIEQKVNITTGVGWMNGLCVGNTYPSVNPDFPGLCLQDAPLGIRFANNVTSGVSGINAAASWDRKAIRARGDYFGQEFRGKGVHVQLGPAMNFMRNPKGGRGWESGGEDPFLQGVMAFETVHGIQDQGVIATAKHFILNDQELHRTTSSSDVDQRTLHEVYLWPFARAVEAGVGSIMCSYNLVNGTYACEDDYTLNTVLKGELGFKGFVHSDWAATHSTVKAANGGLDMTMPGDVTFQSGDSYFGKNLTDAIGKKEVSEARATDMAMRIVATWYKMRQDKNYPKVSLDAFHQDKSPYVNVQGNHGKLVREMGALSNVLLKNVKNTLPINPSKVKKIAVVGSDAGPDPKGINSCADHGCVSGTLAQGWGSGTSDFPYMIDPLKGLTEAFGKKVQISSTLNDWDLDAAAKAAQGADYAFVFSNADSGEEYINVDGNIGDRNNLTLWNNGDNLIKAVADANKNTIVVIHSVGAVLMPWIDHPNIKAVLWPGLPGQESGNSLADIVTGKVSPSARLPYTIAKQESDYAVDIGKELKIEYTEKLNVGYKHFDAAGIEPLFAFGHGLSYTTFDYAKLKVKSKASYKKNDKKSIASASATVTVSVTNSGKVDGAEVVQVYLSFPASANSPPKSLRGFEKIFLKSGKKSNVQIQLEKTELSIWDTVSNQWVIPSGKFTVHVGASSRDIRQTASFTL